MVLSAPRSHAPDPCRGAAPHAGPLPLPPSPRRTPAAPPSTACAPAAGTPMARPRSSIRVVPPLRPTAAGLARLGATNGRQAGGGQSAFRAPAAANGGVPRATVPAYSRRVLQSRVPAPIDLDGEQHGPFDVEGEQETLVNDDVSDQFEASMYPDLNFSDLLDEDNNDQFLQNEVGFNMEVSQEAPSHDTDNGGHASARQKQKRTKNFSEAEDLLLVSAWINISQDPIQGTNQSKNTYWGRIYEYFHTNKTFTSDRNQNSLNKRWGVMQEAVSRFAGCVTRIERRNQSGKTIEDKLVDAQKLFKEEDPKGNKFAFMHCWNVLKHEQKWIDRERDISAGKATNKRQKTQVDSTSPIPNLEEDRENVQSDSGAPSNGQEGVVCTPENNRVIRPPGSKRAKREALWTESGRRRKC